MTPAILIHGPTASGKTALAIEVARRLGGEVINADSMQVYRDLQVISARPTEEEMDGVKHHLFGHVNAAERYSTGEWLEEVRATIRTLELRGKRAVLVGGTGLYLLAMTQGLSNIPPVPDDVRADVRAIADAEGADGLRARLAPVDPEIADRLGTGDRQRLARAPSRVRRLGCRGRACMAKPQRSIASACRHRFCGVSAPVAKIDANTAEYGPNSAKSPNTPLAIRPNVAKSRVSA